MHFLHRAPVWHVPEFRQRLLVKGDKRICSVKSRFDHTHHTRNQTVGFASARYRDDCHRALHVFNNLSLFWG